MYHSGLSITPFVRLATSLKYPSPTYTYSISLSHPQLSGQCSHFSWSPYTLKVLKQLPGSQKCPVTMYKWSTPHS